MKVLPRLVAATLLLLPCEFRAEDPSLSVYKMAKSELGGELALKVNNPTDRTFYVFGAGITCPLIAVDVLKKRKWKVVPRFQCATSMEMHPLLPHSYLVFSAEEEAPLAIPNLTFRLRMALYTNPDRFDKSPSDSQTKRWVELRSPAFRSNDFNDTRPSTAALSSPLNPTPPFQKRPPDPHAGPSPDKPSAAPDPAAAADGPLVSLYETIKEDMNTGDSGEIILKVENPTNRTFYFPGVGIGDIPYHVEVLQGDKWQSIPKPEYGIPWTMRSLLPHSYILFEVIDVPTLHRDVTFRVRAYFYTEPGLPSFRDVPYRKTWIDAVSPSLSSNDIRAEEDAETVTPRLPGIEPFKIFPHRPHPVPDIPGIPRNDVVPE